MVCISLFVDAFGFHFDLKFRKIILLLKLYPLLIYCFLETFTTLSYQILGIFSWQSIMDSSICWVYSCKWLSPKWVEVMRIERLILRYHLPKINYGAAPLGPHPTIDQSIQLDLNTIGINKYKCSLHCKIV